LTYLALDLSRANTGYALWNGKSAKPIYGSWKLKYEFGSHGDSFLKLHRCLSDLYKVEPFDRLYFEEPINPGQLQGATTIQTIWLAFGLASHAQSFAAAKRCRIVKAINVGSWRKDFIGDMIVREVNAGVRRKRKAGEKASATDQLKKLCVERCKQLGINPRSDDEADAIGILTYAILLDGETPPWIADEVLRTPLGAPA